MIKYIITEYCLILGMIKKLGPTAHVNFGPTKGIIIY